MPKCSEPADHSAVPTVEQRTQRALAHLHRRRARQDVEDLQLDRNLVAAQTGRAPTRGARHWTPVRSRGAARPRRQGPGRGDGRARPSTAASCTAGCVMSTSRTSLVATLNPPRTMTSSARPTIQMKSSSSIRARSVVRTQPCWPSCLRLHLEQPHARRAAAPAPDSWSTTRTPTPALGRPTLPTLLDAVPPPVRERPPGHAAGKLGGAVDDEDRHTVALLELPARAPGRAAPYPRSLRSRPRTRRGGRRRQAPSASAAGTSDTARGRCSRTSWTTRRPRTVRARRSSGHRRAH